MRCEQKALERLATMQTVGLDCWEAIERERAVTERRRRVMREQEREVDRNERTELIPDRREY